MTQGNDLQPDLEKLTQKLSLLSKPTLSDRSKMAMRSRIMSKLNSCEIEEVPVGMGVISELLRKLASQIKLSPSKRAVIKEHVFVSMEDVPQKSYFWSNLFLLHKKFVSGAILASLFFGMFSFVSVDVSVVRAETFTVLDSFEGDVTLLRDGKSIVLAPLMELHVGDKITTGSNGEAVVRYFDESVSRLSASTELVIDKLVNSKDSVQSYIEISLVKGMVWSKVLSLVGDESAFVLKANEASAYAKKATFNAELKNEKLEVEVFNRSVDIHKNEKVEKVLRGQKAVINGKVEVVDLNKGDKSIAWVQENLKSDQQYLIATEDRLLDAKVKSMGANAMEDVKMGSSLREDLAVFLTFNDVDKQKKELDLAEKDLVAAEIKLADPNLTSDEKIEVDKALQDFGYKVKSFDQVVKEVSYSDKTYSDELRQYLDNKLLAHQKDLSAVLPNSPLYQVKQVVADASLVGVTDQTELVEKKLDQVSDKLATAEDVALLGETKVAAEVVDDSKVELNNVVQMIGTMDQKVPEAKEGLVVKANEVEKYLTAVSDAQPVLEVPSVVVDGNPTSVAENPVAGASATVSAVSAAVSQSSQENQSVELPLPMTVTSTQYGVTVKGDKPLPPGLGK